MLPLANPQDIVVSSGGLSRDLEPAVTRAATGLSIFRRDQQQADASRPRTKSKLRLPSAFEINRAAYTMENAFCLGVEVIAGKAPNDGCGLFE
jgi:hypothetical protein